MEHKKNFQGATEEDKTDSTVICVSIKCKIHNQMLADIYFLQAVVFIVSITLSRTLKTYRDFSVFCKTTICTP